MTGRTIGTPVLHPAAPSAAQGFRADVEGLRAVAVLAVVAYHAGLPAVVGGYVGVDVFFVLSGFLITGLLLREVEQTGTVSLRRFWARRARRLLPLAALVSTTTLVVAWWVVSPLDRRGLAVDAVWTGLFGMNVHLAREGVDYMADTAPSPFQHYWSLAVEEQFYLAWPLLVLAVVLLSRRRSRRAPGGGRALSPVVAMSVVTGLVVVASFGWGVAQTGSSQPVAYFSPLTRAWELGVGALLALGAPLLAGMPRWLREVAAASGLGAVLLACVLLDDTTPFPGTAALLPVLGTAAVVAAGTGGASLVARALQAGPLQVLGRLSYGWYLWHWPVLLLGPDLLAPLLGEGGDVVDLLVPVLLAVVALGLAALTFAAVEDPLRRHRTLVVRPSLSLLVGAACVVLAAGSGLAGASLLPTVRGTGPAQDPVPVVAEGDAAVERAVRQGQELSLVPTNLAPALVEATEDVARARSEDGVSCMVAVEHRDISREPGGSCVFGEHQDSATTVVLTGDSHAYQWYPAVSRIADERGWRVVVMTKAGCPLYDVTLDLVTLRRDYTECYDWREKVLDRVEQEQPDLVITSAAVFSPRGEDFTARWVDGVASTTRQLRERTDAAVVHLSDTPIPGEDVPGCLAENLDDAKACATDLDDALTDSERRTAGAEAAAAAGATVVDPVPWFCEVTCPAVIGNTVAYHDDDHITATYAEQMAPLLAERLEAAVRSR